MSRDVWTKKRADATGDNGWSERGGYMAAKVSKLEEQFKSDAPREKQKDGSSSIFTGVAIYVNGYTEPSADELRRLMMMHGGQFHVYYSHSKTTHIIANNLPNSKIQALKGEKVIKPGWITDSIKAGRLLPYLHYQLYAKYKGPLFPAAKPRQTSETAGPSGTRRSIPNQESSNSSSPAHKQQGSLQTIPSPQPRHSPSASSHPGPEHSHFSVRPRHGGGSNSHNPRLKASPLNHPQSGVLPPYRLPPQRTDHPEPQTSSGAHQRRHKEVEIRVNGSLQTSAAALTPECIDAPSPLTNGHAHLFNGALKSKDLVLDQICVPTDPSEWGIASPERKDTSPSRLDPYEFPNSPPKQSDHLPVCPEDSCWKDALRSPQPTSLEVDTNPDKIPRSPSPHGHVPVRLNGSHHDAFSSHPASESNSTVRPLPGEAPSESAARLSAQTGGLISEYYAHSRLHQISTWRTGFSEYVNELHSKRKATGVASFPGKERLRKLVAQGAFESRATPTSFAVKSSIFHVDMDCFFVSVGIRHRPELKDKPVAVTSNRGHMRVPLRPGADPHLEQQYFQRKHALPPPGKDLACLRDAAPRESAEVHVNGVDRDASLSMAEIASCSYAARQAGVKNGMFFGQAKQLCPTLQSVPYDFDAYKEVAVTMYETLASYTHDIEALSCDEVLLDASALVAELCVDPEDLAKVIRADIKEKTGCCASIGMGSNILLARLSTRKAKPDGQYFLKSEEVDDFIRDLPVTSLPGVGPVMGRKLAAIGVKSCGDLRQVSLTQLQKKFGPRSGQTLFRFCRGLDDRPVRYEKERKSVSAEMNYNIRFKKVDEAESFLSNLSMEVQRRLQEAGLQGRRVTLKVMVRKDGAPQETSKYGGHGICDNFAKTVMLAQSTDSGQLIAATVIKMFHAMKLPVQDLRGLGIQVQLLEGSHSARNNANALRTRSIKEMLLGRTSTGKEAGDNSKDHEKTPPTRAISPGSIKDPQSPNVSVPGTSKEHEPCRQTPVTPRTSLDFSIEIPSPSQVDRSVLEALPAELRLQVEQSWTCREGRRTNHHRPASPHPRSPKSRPVSPPCPAPPLNNQLVPSGALVLQIPNQPDSPGIILELPNYSQVDPDVFAALPKELQEELKSAYNHAANNQPQTKMSEQNNALLQLKQSVGVGRLKRRYKRKNAVSPAKKGPSPQKKCRPMNSPAKIGPPFTKLKEPVNLLKAENDPSTSSPKQELLPKGLLRPTPALAGASELPDIKTLLREWVTTMTDPMEEDILQVVKYCTDLIEDKDLEKLDLIIKFMKRIMQQSLESVWSMAFDFILDNVQVVVQQTYGSTLKIT